jgi:anti-sigma B factor antagonist
VQAMIEFSGYKHPERNDVFVLEVMGHIDTDASHFLLDCIQGYIDSGEHKFVLDCSELAYISSMGLATLVRANSRLEPLGGMIALAGVKGVAADALRVVHFDRLFNMFPTVNEAAEALDSAKG